MRPLPLLPSALVSMYRHKFYRLLNMLNSPEVRYDHPEQVNQILKSHLQNQFHEFIHMGYFGEDDWSLHLEDLVLKRLARVDDDYIIKFTLLIKIKPPGGDYESENIFFGLHNLKGYDIHVQGFKQIEVGK